MRHYVVITGPGGEARLYPMKQWLRNHPGHVPSSPTPQTTRQQRNALRKRGWVMQVGEQDVRMFPPGEQPVAGVVETGAPEGERVEAGGPSIRERVWVRSLIPRLQAALEAADPTLELRDGYRLAYSREILSYHGAEPGQQAGMRYETDLLVVERVAGGWTPRVVVEAKLRRITTHDAITYSQKAATHKHVHPYLRYGIFLGGRGRSPLPGRLFRHGAHFDFMLSWRALEPTAQEFEAFAALLIDEVRASRLLQDIMFNTRAPGRTGYSVLHKPVIAR